MFYKTMLIFGIKRNKINALFIKNAILLFAFCLSYFYISYGYGYREGFESVKYTFIIVSSYVIGFSICKKNTYRWPYGILWINLALVGGAICIVFLSVYSVIGLTSNINIIGRNVPFFWNKEIEMGGPAIGALASLGICIFPILFFSKKEKPSTQDYNMNFIFLIIVLLSIAGFYANIATQNRTPFLALIVAFCFSSFIYFISRGNLTSGKVIRLIIIIIVISTVYNLLIENIEILNRYAVYNRFLNERLESSRFETWNLMFRAIFNGQCLMGGKEVYLPTLWAHNLWLDVIYETGIIPAIFLLLFHLMHIKPIIGIIRSKLPVFIVILMVNIGISYLINFLQEPTLSANMLYFSTSCFFLGMILRTSEESIYYKQ